MPQNMDFLAPLDDLAVLRISGDDAADFLHAQLSNDISGLGEHEARLAAYCNPKGRMLASLVLWRETPEAGSALLALVKADATEALLKRLRMFVLRAKVTIEATTLRVYGASLSAAAAARPVPPAADGESLVLGAGTVWQLRRQDRQAFISAPAAANGPARWWVIDAPHDKAATLAESLGLEMRNAAAWRTQDIEAGLGWVEQSNLELFIPQSLNYDLNGGVSFTKGCYPGQEIVARAHFRGTVKRRGVPGHCHLPEHFTLSAGMDIFDARKPEAPAGRIINAAGSAELNAASRTWHVFVEINLAELDEADFRVVSAEGPAISLLPLPYSLEAGTD